MKLCAQLLVLLALSACTSSALTRIEKQNIALVERYIDAVEDLDYEIMDELLAEDYLGIGPSHSDTITKDIAIANWQRNVAELYDRIEYRRSRNIATSVRDGENKGNWVANWAELEITYKGDGDRVTLYVNTIYRIVDNRIAESVTIYNEADALEQLGYVFIDAEALYE